MIDNILTCTNLYIENKKQNFTRDRDCKITSSTEIQALFGALYIIAVKKGNRVDVRELWSTDGTGMIRLRAAFSFRRFLFLLRALRFDNINTRKERQNIDKLAAIRDIYSDFVKNCMNNYIPGEFITIDEMLHPFRGRCGFVQYMPQKPPKYGIKIYALCDSRTYYTWNLEIYCGQQRDGPFQTSNKPFDIVRRLVDPLNNSKRNLTTDNHYTSYPLADYLLQNGLTLIGTIKKNKKEIPPEFLPNKARIVGSKLFGFQDEINLVSYVPKKNKAVIILSSFDDKGEDDEATNKPTIILDYNRTKSGVDTVDQKCASYTTQRRWPLAIFSRILDITGINAEIGFNNTKPTEESPRRRKFLNELGVSLMEHHMAERAKIITLPKDIREFFSRYQTTVDEVPAIKQNGSGRCHVCSAHKNNKTTVRCDSCYQFVCKSHCKKTVQCDTCLNTPMEED
ncbi:unnamed protein product [Acanthoscelides obtectus]|uniref:PiggyBac transposable element-derived protein domain-containing protein n=1 Tax=Acanthoscelides obtectus TaxID=200917 RepID=A0A9P0PZY8_ACAOB|nr:unnamed protein product [Acanthoscelides obtectus]CAK1662413.1 PiggyBac transposable element-derived protein 4 [Acanthoscelides obtectus]